jgi:hypothetical protein
MRYHIFVAAGKTLREMRKNNMGASKIYRLSQKRLWWSGAGPAAAAAT